MEITLKNQEEIFNQLKSILKKFGFNTSLNTWFKVSNDLAFIVFLYKSKYKETKGLYCLNLGIIIDYYDDIKMAYQNCDFIHELEITFNSVEEFANAILNWFEERNRLEKIKNLFDKNQLAKFILPNIVEYLQEI